MKRIIAFLLALLVLAAVTPLFAGGGGQQAGVSAPKSKEEHLLYIAGGSVGGSAYITAAALGQLFSNKLPNVTATGQVTAGGGESWINFVTGESDLVIQNNDAPYVGYRGGSASVMACPSFRMLFEIEGSPIIVIAKEKRSDLNSYLDILKPGLKITAGTPGTAQNILLQQMLPMIGGNISQITQFPAGQGASAEALADDNIDMIKAIAPHYTQPAAAWQQLFAQHDIKFLPIPEDLLDKVIRDMPYWEKIDLQPIYAPNDLKGPYRTLGLGMAVGIHAHFPDDLVYEMTKAIFENLDELALALPVLGNLKKTATVGLPAPLHPGAERYYKENGFKIEYLPEPPPKR